MQTTEQKKASAAAEKPITSRDNGEFEIEQEWVRAETYKPSYLDELTSIFEEAVDEDVRQKPSRRAESK